jgi:flagellar basal-body rod protein FlgB
MSDKFLDKTSSVLGTSLNFRTMRQNVLTSNIANANTPGYKALKLDFEKALQDAADTEGTNTVQTSNPAHIKQGGGGLEHAEVDIYEEPDYSPSNDMNTVDVESEMAKMTENEILYEATTQLLNKKLGQMKYAIAEGGKS